MCEFFHLKLCHTGLPLSPGTGKAKMRSNRRGPGRVKVKKQFQSKVLIQIIQCPLFIFSDVIIDKGKVLSHKQSQENASLLFFWEVFHQAASCFLPGTWPSMEDVPHKFQTSSERPPTWPGAPHFVDTDVQLLRQMNHTRNKQVQ